MTILQQHILEPNQPSFFAQRFLKLCIEAKALKFGEFKLKSGRISPYFFNAGLFKSGAQLAELGLCFAQAIEHYNINFDVLFGPAYKGIPLATSTVMALSQTPFSKDIPYAFNRKEIKSYGDGGQIVGSELKGKILIIDDVITAGTAIKESIDLIQSSGAQIGGALVLLDRQEKAPDSDLSAIENIEKQFNFPVYSIANLQNILDIVQSDEALNKYSDAIKNYHSKYGTGELQGMSE